MPNWSDENGRYWWTPPGKNWYDAIEIPHPEVSIPQRDCKCIACETERSRKKIKIK